MKLTSAEWKVMNRVWSRHPTTAREVLESQPEDVGWAYTTVKTIMARLVEKGALSMQMEGNTSRYEPRIGRMQARLAAVRSLLETAFGGTPGPLLHLLVDEEKLSPEEREELLQKLEELEAEELAKERGP
jgi:BlaI family transcriptional regulator, penicillinase repressor